MSQVYFVSHTETKCTQTTRNPAIQIQTILVTQQRAAATSLQLLPHTYGTEQTNMRTRDAFQILKCTLSAPSCSGSEQPGRELWRGLSGLVRLLAHAPARTTRRRARVAAPQRRRRQRMVAAARGCRRVVRLVVSAAGARVNIRRCAARALAHAATSLGDGACFVWPPRPASNLPAVCVWVHITFGPDVAGRGMAAWIVPRSPSSSRPPLAAVARAGART